MFYVYSVPNMNPSLGPVKNGKQAVSVYDRELGNRRTVITSAEEADAFVSFRKKALEKAAQKGMLDGLLLMAAGAGVGAGVGAYTESEKSNKINSLIEPLNKEFKELLAEKPDMVVTAKSSVLNLDAYKKYADELRKLFSEETKEFTKIDVAKAVKDVGKYGALIGAAIAGIFGLFIPAFKVENKDKQLTDAFIRYNKDEKAVEA